MPSSSALERRWSFEGDPGKEIVHEHQRTCRSLCGSVLPAGAGALGAQVRAEIAGPLGSGIGYSYGAGGPSHPESHSRFLSE